MTGSPLPDDVATAVSLTARAEGGRVVALLAGRLGDLDLADESVQDALEEALRTWPERGVPDNRAGWLLTVARRKAIDRLRRADSHRRRLREVGPDLVRQQTPDPTDPEEVPEMALDHAGIADDRLRVLLLCCHPALHRSAQVALTLRLVGGLSTPEIAAAYLIPEATLAQRIVRAKRKIRDARIPLTIPADLTGRVDAALQVIYLIFNEGYLSRGAEAGPVRVDLTAEAVRLTEQLVALLSDPHETGRAADSEARGLLALELFHHARTAARTDATGELVLLPDQDRTRWDGVEIARANGLLATATADLDPSRPPGPFVLQAMIAGFHANARTAADTDWPAVVGVYDALLRLDPSPVVGLNRAVTVGQADGPHAGLAQLAAVEGLDGYHLLHAARAELSWRAGDHATARTAFERARQLTANPAEQRHLSRRLAALTAAT